MANLKDRAQKILNDVGYIPPGTQKKNTFATTKNSISIRDRAQRILDNVGYVPPKKQVYEDDMQKRAVAFDEATKNALSDVQNASNNMTTVESELSDGDREARIGELDKKIKHLKNVSVGYQRGRSLQKLKETEDEIAKLTAEKRTLERVGTFSEKELLEFELEDAKKDATDYYSTRRPMRDHVETYKAETAKRNQAKIKLSELEKKQSLYEDVDNFSNDINEDDFVGQTAANYRSADLSRKADKAMSAYLSNPTEENKQIAYAYDALVKEYMANNEEALDDENVKASWISKTAAGYIPQLTDQLAPQIVGGAIGAGAGYFVGQPLKGAAAGAGLATTAQSYDVMRGSIYRGLIAEGIDEEIALQAANDEALVSSMIEGADTALDILMLSGAGKALSAIGKAATVAVKKGSTNVATKLIASIASNSINREAKKAATAAVGKSLLKTGLSFAGNIAGNAGSEYLEEASQQAVSISNKERAMSGNADGSLVWDSTKLAFGALTGKNPEALSEMHEAGKEGAKIGLMFGGTNAVLNNSIAQYFNAKTVKIQNEIADTIIQDDEALTALIKEGKASGEGTVSAKIAEEIETARENGEVTREQVKSLIESNEVYIKNEEINASENEALEEAARYVVENRDRTSGVEEDLNETSSIELEKDIEDYPYNAQETIEGYADSVNPKILSFIDRVHSLENDSYKKRQSIEISPVNKRFAENVKKLTGIDVSGYKNVLTGNSLWHIEKDHGKNGTADHSMANAEDIARIGFVVENFDTIGLSVDKDGNNDLDWQYRNSDGTGAKKIVLGKKINGTFYVVEVVPNSNAKTISVKTAYISKNNNISRAEGALILEAKTSRQLTSETLNHANTTNDGITQAPNADNSALGSTPEASLASLPSTNSIPRYNENVKSLDGDLKAHKARAIQAAYEAGKADVPSDKLSFETDEQIDAYFRGRREAIMADDQIKNTQTNLDRSDVVFAENDYSMSFNAESTESESKKIIKIIRSNIPSISADSKFDVQYSAEAEQYNRKYDYVLKVFDDQGNIAVNPKIGNVELVRSGAKSTIAHGYGRTKLAAVAAIKSVIENGTIVSYTSNYENSNVDRYVIAAKGNIDGIPAYIGVVVKSYPNQKSNSKFYLHEAEIIKADSPYTTAPQLSVDTVGESTSTNSIPHSDEIVNKIKNNSTAISSADKLLEDKPKLLKGLRRLCVGLNIRVKFFDGEALGIKGVDGFYDKDSRIMYLDFNRPQKPIQATVRHEVIHVFRQMSEKGFKAFSEFIVGRYKAKYGEEGYNTWIENKKTEYASMGKKLSDDGAMEELCADFGMDIMNNKADVNAFIMKDKNAAQKLRDIIHRMMNTVRRAFGLSENITLDDAMRQLADFDSTVSTTSGKVERSHTPYGYDGLPGVLSVAELRQAQELFLEGIAEYEKAERYVLNRNGKLLNSLSGDARLNKIAELVAERLGDEFTADEGGKTKYSLVGQLDDGRKIYKNNYPENTPKAVKQNDIINLVQNVWSKKPIRLTLNNGTAITAKFDPTLAERSDLSKIAFGNRKGSGSDKRITLSLAPDFYQIAEDSNHVFGKNETGKENPAHNGVRRWEYFVTNLVFEENDGKRVDCYMNIDVKRKQDGDFFYSFGIEKGTAPQTLLAVVSENDSPTVPSDTIVPQENGGVNTYFTQEDQETFSFSANTPDNSNTESIEDSDNATDNQTARYAKIPQKDRYGRTISRHIQTIHDAIATPDEYASPILEDAKNGKYSHDVITDNAAKKNAFEKISIEQAVLDENGKDTGKTERVVDTEKYKKALDGVIERFENGELLYALDDQISGKDTMALMQALYTHTASNFDYMNSVDENGVPVVEKLISAMVQTASRAGQTLQAAKLLEKVTPAGKLYHLLRFIDNTNKEIRNQWGEWSDEIGGRLWKSDKDSRARRKASRRHGLKFTKSQKDIKINEDLKTQLLEAKNQTEVNEIEEKIIVDIAHQLESTFGDKLRAYRYTAMLLNSRTHIRNLAGNTAFIAPVFIRDNIDATLQKAFIKDKSKRTKVFTHEVPREMIDFADKVFKDQMGYIRGDSGRYDTLNSKIEENRKIFKTKFPEWVRATGSNALEAEDIWFIRLHFKHQFAKALAAKGITLSDIESGKVSDRVLEETMKYAALQAQKATFRDASTLAKAINKFQSTNIATDIGVTATLPFKKTPINIFKRGVEYSPLAVIEAIGHAIYENAQVKNGRLESVDVVGILENLSEGLTGTAIMGIGYFLVRAGILAIRPGDDEDDEKLGEAMGHQSYALEIGGYSITIDWAAPVVMPLFVGAELANMAGYDEGTDYFKAILSISNPLLETSFLSGLLGAFDSIRYSETESDMIVDFTSELMSSYILQYVPSMFGAIARTFDVVDSRTSRPSYNGTGGFLEMLWRKIANKLPLLRNAVNSKPYVDIMGKYDKKEDFGDYALSFFQNFVLPGYISKIASAGSAKELSKIVDSSERTDFIPKYVTKIKDHKLTHNEYFYYHKERGELYDDVVPYLSKQSWYKKLSADEKAEILADFKEAADKLTKKSFLPSDYDINNNKLERIFRDWYSANGYKGKNGGALAKDIVNIYLYDKYLNLGKSTKSVYSDDVKLRSDILNSRNGDF